MSAPEPQWILCKCGSSDVQAMMIATPEHGRSVLTTCRKCGFRVEYRRIGNDVREFIHVRRGDVPDMQTASLKSNVIATASFDAERNVIQLHFRNGNDYEYAVDPEVKEPPDIRVLYMSLIHAESAGEFFSRFIRPKSSGLLCTNLTKLRKEKEDGQGELPMKGEADDQER